jgi:adenylate cyclase
MWALRQKIWEWRGVLVTAPSVAGLLIVLRLVGLLQSLELWALDQYFRLRPLEPIDPRIVIVGINETDLKKVGTWPVPDAVIAQLLEKLKKQQPRAIGLDLFRDIPIEPGHQALVKVFESTPNLIGVEKIVGDDRSFVIAPPPVLSQLGQVSSVDVVVDADSKLRRGMLYLTPEDGESVPSLGLTLALIYLETQGITPEPAAINPQFLQLGQAVFVPFEANDGGYARADAGGYQILLNFRGPAQSFRTISMTEVLENQIPPDLVRDRIVLIGVTATSIKDFFNTPYSSSLITAPQQTPGVEIQANLTSQILGAALSGRPLIETWSDPLELLWIFLWSCCGATLSWIGHYAGGVTSPNTKPETGYSVGFQESLLEVSASSEG